MSAMQVQGRKRRSRRRTFEKFEEQDTILKAARNKKPRLLSELVGKGLPLDVKDNRGWIALHEAANNADFESLSILLAEGATLVNTKSHDCVTPLYLATQQNSVDCVELLLSFDADPNIFQFLLETPLMAAVVNGNKSVINLLLKYNADVNARKYDGCTALHVAVKNKDLEIVDLLLKNGADISVRDENGLNAIMYALCEAEVDHSILNTLLNTDRVNKSFEALQKTVNTPAYDGATALYLAVQIASKEIMLLLLSVGADPDLVLRDEKLAPVHAAIALGHIELVEHLLPITLNSTLLRLESSPISMACDNGKSEMIKFLISHPRINLTESFPLPGYFCITPQSPYYTISYLTEAIMKDADLEIIKMLVQNGVPISCINSSEIPPFYMAIYKNNVQVASYLLKIGANVNVYLNDTMFNYSWVASDNLQVIKLILRHGAEYDSILNCNLSDMLNMHKDEFFKPRLKTAVSVICYLTNELPHGSEECLELPLVQLLSKSPRSLKCLCRNVIRRCLFLPSYSLNFERLNRLMPFTLTDYVLNLNDIL